MERYLEGKIAIVTGVSSGLGVGISKAFADLGAHVVGLARRSTRGQALEREICASGRRFTFHTCDVTNPSDCQGAVEATLAQLGHIDILINNAGTSGARPILPVEQMYEDDWDSILNVNLRAPFTMARLVLPSMQARKDGVIINIASINGVIGVANMAAYNSSKAGLLHLTQTIAVENAAKGVRCIGIIMGGVDSEMAHSVSEEMGRVVHGRDWQRTSAYRSGPPDRAEQYGRALALFCSDDARVITGTTIALDGGATAGSLASRMIYLGVSGSL